MRSASALNLSSPTALSVARTILHRQSTGLDGSVLSSLLVLEDRAAMSPIWKPPKLSYPTFWQNLLTALCETPMLFATIVVEL